MPIPNANFIKVNTIAPSAALRLSAVTNAKNRPGEDAAQKTLHQAVTHGTHKRLADGYKVFGILGGPTATSVRAITLPSL